MPIYITPTEALTDNAIFEDLDNWVFDNGDNVIFAIAGQPPQLIEDVYIGDNAMASVYAGADLVHENPNSFDLTSQTEVNLATFLGTQTPDVNRPVIVNVPAGNIIGSTDKTIPALTSGDLSSYTKGVTLNVIGEIQGAREGNAVEVTSEMWVHNTGAIRAGGGNGGTGGKGGTGNDRTGAVAGPLYRDDPADPYWWYQGTSIDSRWAGVKFRLSVSNAVWGFNTTKIYWRGASQGSNYYEIARQDLTTGVGGAGGAGGLGIGYNAARSDGSAGSAGTFRSGQGGSGGSGGEWGVAGDDGSVGTAGLYYTATSSSAVRSGVKGASGTAGGISVNAIATVHYSGDGIVNGTGEGSISPVVAISRPAPGECEYQYPETECTSQTVILSTTGYFTGPPDVYEWSAVGATIVSGQGTETIVIETTGGSDIPFTVTLIATYSQTGESASVTASFTDIRNINQNISYNGTPIVIPTLTTNQEMTPVDTSGSFDGFVEDYELVGNWPTGLDIDQYGVISGAPSDAGSFDGQVRGIGEINNADSDAVNFSVQAEDWTPTLLYNLPLSDVAVPVDMLEEWPFVADNDFLLCAKFDMPSPLPVATVYAMRFKWKLTAAFISIQVLTNGQLRCELNDGVYNQITTTAPPSGTVEVKYFKSSTRGMMVWINNVKLVTTKPTLTAPLSTFEETTWNIGCDNTSSNCLNEQMYCIQIFTGDMTDAEIQSITLCEEQTTPPAGNLDHMEDADTNVPTVPTPTLYDWTTHKHPKTLHIETAAPSGDAALKWMVLNANATGMKSLNDAWNNGHRCISHGWTPAHESEHTQTSYTCGHGWFVPFTGTTDNGGDMVDSSNYGTSRPHADCPGGIPAGWWVYQAGANLTQAVNSEETQFFVNNTSVFTQGEYVVICDGVGDFTKGEHCRVASVGSGWIAVERGYLSTKVSHGANSYIAQHQRSNNGPLYWIFNYSQFCQVDGNGKTIATFGSEYMPNHMNENISGNQFNDVEFVANMYDLGLDYLAGGKADVNNDGVADSGFADDGTEWYNEGFANFYELVNGQFPDFVQMGGTMWDTILGDNAQNGTQLEGSPFGFSYNPVSYKTGDMSTTMVDMSFRAHRMRRGPSINQLHFKQPTLLYDGGYAGTMQNWPFRVMMGIAMMEDAYQMQQKNRTGSNDPWWDEWAVNLNPSHATYSYGQAIPKGDYLGCQAASGWLGDPIDNAEQPGGWRRRIYDNNTFDPANAIFSADFDTDTDSMEADNVTITRVTDTTMAGAGSLHASKQIVPNKTSKTGAWVRTPQMTFDGGDYTVCFSAKAGHQRRIGHALGSHSPAKILIDTEWRRYVMTYTPQAGTGRFTFYLGEQNTEFWMDEIFIFKGGSDVFMREFDNGMVVLNMNTTDTTVNLGTGSYQRILGTQDPINNGQAVGNNLIVPARELALLVRQQ